MLRIDLTVDKETLPTVLNADDFKQQLIVRSLYDLA
ncbi:hypothetical protein J2S11_001746 [Bacillus horti]|uniref:Uncharacterized protein n=1 Tax=Caldalkalibacillus horti TaxID=77523 RepID=A0ABT9VYA1_9BACI|nr:hypothetical protein [Bacillus horti]